MAKIISNKQTNKVIGMFEDDHEFSPAELDGFNINSIPFTTSETLSWYESQIDYSFPERNYSLSITNPGAATLNEIFTVSY